MFYYFKGTVAILEQNLAVIDCGGVGYACHTTVYTRSQLKLNQTATLYTHCNIREDAFDVYGFSTRQELQYFQMLIGVTGVGPKAALAILSATTPDTFALAILTGDEKAITAAQGVGKKLAQRILLELKDKLAGQTAELDFSGGTVPLELESGHTAEVTAALAALGYSQADIGVALRGVDVAQLSVQDSIRAALRNMMK